MWLSIVRHCRTKIWVFQKVKKRPKLIILQLVNARPGIASGVSDMSDIWVWAKPMSWAAKRWK